MKAVHMGIMAIMGIMVIATMIPFTMQFSDSIVGYDNNMVETYTLTDRDVDITFELVDGYGYINGTKVKGIYNGSMLMFSDSFVLSYPGADSGNIQQCLFAMNNASSAMIIKLVAENGAYTATKADGTTYEGTYNFLFSYDKNGNYTRIVTNSANDKFYINPDRDIYVAWATTSTHAGVMKGTINNLDVVFDNGAERSEYSITSNLTGTNPEVYEITSVTAEYSTFIPIQYKTTTNMSEMTRTIINLSPLFIGIILFAGMGIYLTRLNKL